MATTATGGKAPTAPRRRANSTDSWLLTLLSHSPHGFHTPLGTARARPRIYTAHERAAAAAEEDPKGSARAQAPPRARRRRRRGRRARGHACPRPPPPRTRLSHDRASRPGDA